MARSGAEAAPSGASREDPLPAPLARPSLEVVDSGIPSFPALPFGPRSLPRARRATCAGQGRSRAAAVACCMYMHACVRRAGPGAREPR
eukprot:scaffold137_cov398-Prasinococcus_capsulatus_cf.AAC.67